jgi:hypothetical protein
MRREPNRQLRQPASGAGNALSEYLVALEAIYPPSKGETRVITRPDKRVIVSTRLPTRAEERMQLFDHMAEVGTRLLLETDQYIILSSR